VFDVPLIRLIPARGAGEFVPDWQMTRRPLAGVALTPIDPDDPYDRWPVTRGGRDSVRLALTQARPHGGARFGTGARFAGRARRSGTCGPGFTRPGDAPWRASAGALPPHPAMRETPLVEWTRGDGALPWLNWIEASPASRHAH
jgi:hypothetical protein